MNDFLNIKWKYKNYDDYNIDRSTFVDDLNNSYAYKKIVDNDSSSEDSIEIRPIKEYIPGCSYYTKDLPYSCLNKDEQCKCLQALELYQSGRTNLLLQEQNLINTYLRLKEKIIIENAKFLDHVKLKWTSSKDIKIKPVLLKFALDRWKEKLKLVHKYVQYYRQYETVPFSVDENSEPIEMVQQHNLLELGTVAKFSQPTLTMKTTFAVNTLPQTEEDAFNSKLPVSMDRNIQDILQKHHDIDVIMSSGSLTKFINYMDEQPWDLPVIIRNETVKDDEGTKNKKIVYIDKPLAKKNININDVNEYIHKILIKTNFCSTEEFSFPTTEAKLTTEEETEEEINLGMDEAEEAKVNKALKFKGKIHHNVSYRHWKLHMNEDKNDVPKFKYKTKHFNVLIRCKVDACESTDTGTFNPICIFAKMENQLNYGANVPTKSELGKQWVLLSSRPFSKLYRARIHNATSEVVVIENCAIQKINTEAIHHYKYKPYQGLNLLYKFLNEITKYEIGNYLIRYSPKTGPFLLALKECDKDIAGVYDLHVDYRENCKYSKEVNRNWCPIDVNYILPIHKQMMRLPGLFKPSFVKPKGPFKKNGKKRKKKKANVV